MEGFFIYPVVTKKPHAAICVHPPLNKPFPFNLRPIPESFYPQPYSRLLGGESLDDLKI
jgi:hypothetical protein